jgi:membrane protein implicated in regulation of membrane protease activity
VKAPGSRLLTIVAAAVLAFDGTALAGVGMWSGRLMLVLPGAVCLISSGLVVLYWRWYQRRLKTIADLRQGLAEETRELQRFLSEK